MIFLSLSNAMFLIVLYAVEGLTSHKETTTRFRQHFGITLTIDATNSDKAIHAAHVLARQHVAELQAIKSLLSVSHIVFTDKDDVRGDDASAKNPCAFSSSAKRVHDSLLRTAVRIYINVATMDAERIMAGLKEYVENQYAKTLQVVYLDRVQEVALYAGESLAHNDEGTQSNGTASVATVDQISELEKLIVVLQYGAIVDAPWLFFPHTTQSLSVSVGHCDHVTPTHHDLSDTSADLYDAQSPDRGFWAPRDCSFPHNSKIVAEALQLLNEELHKWPRNLLVHSKFRYIFLASLPTLDACVLSTQNHPEEALYVDPFCAVYDAHVFARELHKSLFAGLHMEHAYLLRWQELLSPPASRGEEDEDAGEDENATATVALTDVQETMGGVFAHVAFFPIDRTMELHRALTADVRLYLLILSLVVYVSDHDGTLAQEMLAVEAIFPSSLADMLAMHKDSLFARLWNRRDGSFTAEEFDAWWQQFADSVPNTTDFESDFEFVTPQQQLTSKLLRQSGDILHYVHTNERARPCKIHDVRRYQWQRMYACGKERSDWKNFVLTSGDKVCIHDQQQYTHLRGTVSALAAPTCTLSHVQDVDDTRCDSFSRRAHMTIGDVIDRVRKRRSLIIDVLVRQGDCVRDIDQINKCGHKGNPTGHFPRCSCMCLEGYTGSRCTTPPRRECRCDLDRTGYTCISDDSVVPRTTHTCPMSTHECRLSLRPLSAGVFWEHESLRVAPCMPKLGVADDEGWRVVYDTSDPGSCFIYDKWRTLLRDANHVRITYYEDHYKKVDTTTQNAHSARVLVASEFSLLMQEFKATTYNLEKNSIKVRFSMPPIHKYDERFPRLAFRRPCYGGRVMIALLQTGVPSGHTCNCDGKRRRIICRMGRSSTVVRECEDRHECVARWPFKQENIKKACAIPIGTEHENAGGNDTDRWHTIYQCDTTNNTFAMTEFLDSNWARIVPHATALRTCAVHNSSECIAMDHDAVNQTFTDILSSFRDATRSSPTFLHAFVTHIIRHAPQYAHLALGRSKETPHRFYCSWNNPRDLNRIAIQIKVPKRCSDYSVVDCAHYAFTIQHCEVSREGEKPQCVDKCVRTGVKLTGFKDSKVASALTLSSCQSSCTDLSPSQCLWWQYNSVSHQCAIITRHDGTTESRAPGFTHGDRACAQRHARSPAPPDTTTDSPPSRRILHSTGCNHNAHSHDARDTTIGVQYVASLVSELRLGVVPHDGHHNVPHGALREEMECALGSLRVALHAHHARRPQTDVDGSSNGANTEQSRGNSVSNRAIMEFLRRALVRHSVTTTYESTFSPTALVRCHDNATDSNSCRASDTCATCPSRDTLYSIRSQLEELCMPHLLPHLHAASSEHSVACANIAANANAFPLPPRVFPEYTDVHAAPIDKGDDSNNNIILLLDHHSQASLAAAAFTCMAYPTKKIIGLRAHVHISGDGDSGRRQIEPNAPQFDTLCDNLTFLTVDRTLFTGLKNALEDAVSPLPAWMVPLRQLVDEGNMHADTDNDTRFVMHHRVRQFVAALLYQYVYGGIIYHPFQHPAFNFDVIFGGASSPSVLDKFSSELKLNDAQMEKVKVAASYRAMAEMYRRRDSNMVYEDDEDLWSYHGATLTSVLVEGTKVHMTDADIPTFDTLWQELSAAVREHIADRDGKMMPSPFFTHCVAEEKRQMTSLRHVPRAHMFRASSTYARHGEPALLAPPQHPLTEVLLEAIVNFASIDSDLLTSIAADRTFVDVVLSLVDDKDTNKHAVLEVLFGHDGAHHNNSSSAHRFSPPPAAAAAGAPHNGHCVGSTEVVRYNNMRHREESPTTVFVRPVGTTRTLRDEYARDAVENRVLHVLEGPRYDLLARRVDTLCALLNIEEDDGEREEKSTSTRRRLMGGVAVGGYMSRENFSTTHILPKMPPNLSGETSVVRSRNNALINMQRKTLLLVAAKILQTEIQATNFRNLNRIASQVTLRAKYVSLALHKELGFLKLGRRGPLNLQGTFGVKNQVALVHPRAVPAVLGSATAPRVGGAAVTAKLHTSTQKMPSLRARAPGELRLQKIALAASPRARSTLVSKLMTFPRVVPADLRTAIVRASLARVAPMSTPVPQTRVFSTPLVKLQANHPRLFSVDKTWISRSPAVKHASWVWFNHWNIIWTIGAWKQAVKPIPWKDGTPKEITTQIMSIAKAVRWLWPLHVMSWDVIKWIINTPLKRAVTAHFHADLKRIQRSIWKQIKLPFYGTNIAFGVFAVAFGWHDVHLRVVSLHRIKKGLARRIAVAWLASDIIGWTVGLGLYIADWIATVIRMVLLRATFSAATKIAAAALAASLSSLAGIFCLILYPIFVFVGAVLSSLSYFAQAQKYLHEWNRQLPLMSTQFNRFFCPHLALADSHRGGSTNIPLTHFRLATTGVIGRDTLSHLNVVAFQVFDTHYTASLDKTFYDTLPYTTKLAFPQRTTVVQVSLERLELPLNIFDTAGTVTCEHKSWKSVYAEKISWEVFKGLFVWVLIYELTQPVDTSLLSFEFGKSCASVSGDYTINPGFVDVANVEQVCEQVDVASRRSQEISNLRKKNLDMEGKQQLYFEYKTPQLKDGYRVVSLDIWKPRLYLYTPAVPPLGDTTKFITIIYEISFRASPSNANDDEEETDGRMGHYNIAAPLIDYTKARDEKNPQSFTYNVYKTDVRQFLLLEFKCEEKRDEDKDNLTLAQAVDKYWLNIRWDFLRLASYPEGTAITMRWGDSDDKRVLRFTPLSGDARYKIVLDRGAYHVSIDYAKKTYAILLWQWASPEFRTAQIHVLDLALRMMAKYSTWTDEMEAHGFTRDRTPVQIRLSNHDLLSIAYYNPSPAPKRPWTMFVPKRRYAVQTTKRQNSAIYGELVGKNTFLPDWDIFSMLPLLADARGLLVDYNLTSLVDNVTLVTMNVTISMTGSPQIEAFSCDLSALKGNNVRTPCRFKLLHDALEREYARQGSTGAEYRSNLIFNSIEETQTGHPVVRKWYSAGTAFTRYVLLEDYEIALGYDTVRQCYLYYALDPDTDNKLNITVKAKWGIVDYDHINDGADTTMTSTDSWIIEPRNQEDPFVHAFARDGKLWGVTRHNLLYRLGCTRAFLREAPTFAPEFLDFVEPYEFALFRTVPAKYMSAPAKETVNSVSIYYIKLFDKYFVRSEDSIHFVGFHEVTNTGLFVTEDNVVRLVSAVTYSNATFELVGPSSADDADDYEFVPPLTCSNKMDSDVSDESGCTTPLMPFVRHTISHKASKRTIRYSVDAAKRVTIHMVSEVHDAQTRDHTISPFLSRHASAYVLHRLCTDAPQDSCVYRVADIVVLRETRQSVPHSTKRSDVVLVSKSATALVHATIAINGTLSDVVVDTTSNAGTKHVRLPTVRLADLNNPRVLNVQKEAERDIMMLELDANVRSLELPDIAGHAHLHIAVDRSTSDLRVSRTIHLRPLTHMPASVKYVTLYVVNGGDIAHRGVVVQSRVCVRMENRDTARRSKPYCGREADGDGIEVRVFYISRMPATNSLDPLWSTYFLDDDNINSSENGNEDDKEHTFSGTNTTASPRGGICVDNTIVRAYECSCGTQICPSLHVCHAQTCHALDTRAVYDALSTIQTVMEPLAGAHERSMPRRITTKTTAGIVTLNVVFCICSQVTARLCEPVRTQHLCDFTLVETGVPRKGMADVGDTVLSVAFVLSPDPASFHASVLVEFGHRTNSWCAETLGTAQSTTMNMYCTHILGYENNDVHTCAQQRVFPHMDAYLPHWIAATRYEKFIPESSSCIRVRPPIFHDDEQQQHGANSNYGAYADVPLASSMESGFVVIRGTLYQAGRSANDDNTDTLMAQTVEKVQYALVGTLSDSEGEKMHTTSSAYSHLIDSNPLNVTDKWAELKFVKVNMRVAHVFRLLKNLIQLLEDLHASNITHNELSAKNIFIHGISSRFERVMATEQSEQQEHGVELEEYIEMSTNSTMALRLVVRNSMRSPWSAVGGNHKREPFKYSHTVWSSFDRQAINIDKDTADSVRSDIKSICHMAMNLLQVVLPWELARSKQQVWPNPRDIQATDPDMSSLLLHDGTFLHSSQAMMKMIAWLRHTMMAADADLPSRYAQLIRDGPMKDSLERFERYWPELFHCTSPLNAHYTTRRWLEKKYKDHRAHDTPSPPFVLNIIPAATSIADTLRVEDVDDSDVVPSHSHSQRTRHTSTHSDGDSSVGLMFSTGCHAITVEVDVCTGANTIHRLRIHYDGVHDDPRVLANTTLQHGACHTERAHAKLHAPMDDVVHGCPYAITHHSFDDVTDIECMQRCRRTPVHPSGAHNRHASVANTHYAFPGGNSTGRHCVCYRYDNDNDNDGLFGRVPSKKQARFDHGRFCHAIPPRHVCRSDADCVMPAQHNGGQARCIADTRGRRDPTKCTRAQSRCRCSLLVYKTNHGGSRNPCQRECGNKGYCTVMRMYSRVSYTWEYCSRTPITHEYCDSFPSVGAESSAIAFQKMRGAHIMSVTRCTQPIVPHGTECDVISALGYAGGRVTCHNGEYTIVAATKHKVGQQCAVDTSCPGNSVCYTSDGVRPCEARDENNNASSRCVCMQFRCRTLSNAECLPFTHDGRDRHPGCTAYTWKDSGLGGQGYYCDTSIMHHWDWCAHDKCDMLLNCSDEFGAHDEEGESQLLLLGTHIRVVDCRDAHVHGSRCRITRWDPGYTGGEVECRNGGHTVVRPARLFNAVKCDKNDDCASGSRCLDNKVGEGNGDHTLLCGVKVCPTVVGGLNNPCRAFTCPARTNNKYRCSGNWFVDGDAYADCSYYKAASHHGTWCAVTDTSAYTWDECLADQCVVYVNCNGLVPEEELEHTNILSVNCHHATVHHAACVIEKRTERYIGGSVQCANGKYHIRPAHHSKIIRDCHEDADCPVGDSFCFDKSNRHSVTKCSPRSHNCHCASVTCMSDDGYECNTRTGHHIGCSSYTKSNTGGYYCSLNPRLNPWGYTWDWCMSDKCVQHANCVGEFTPSETVKSGSGIVAADCHNAIFHGDYCTITRRHEGTASGLVQCVDGDYTVVPAERFPKKGFCRFNLVTWSPRIGAYSGLGHDACEKKCRDTPPCWSVTITDANSFEGPMCVLLRADYPHTLADIGDGAEVSTEACKTECDAREECKAYAIFTEEDIQKYVLNPEQYKGYIRPAVCRLYKDDGQTDASSSRLSHTSTTFEDDSLVYEKTMCYAKE